MASVSEQAKAVWGLLFGVLFWSINAAIARSFSAEIPPMMMSIFRWGGASIVILPFVYRDLPNAWKLFKKTPWQILILSFLCITVFNTLQYKAGETTQSININLIITMCPPLTYLLAFVVNREKLNFFGFSGLILALIGTLTVISKGNPDNVLSLTFVEGDMFMILGITAWGMYTVLLRRFKIQCKPITLLALMIWFGLLMLIAIYFIFPVNNQYTFKKEHIYVYVYLWIFPTLISQMCWMYAVKILGAGPTAFGLYTAPIYGSLIGYYFLSENMHWFHLIGGLLILCGFYLSFSRKKNKTPA